MTDHLRSNIEVIQLFLPVRIDCQEEGSDRLRIAVSPTH
jgi:RNA 3'-terminal phosphate cyclase (ATP)